MNNGKILYDVIKEWQNETITNKDLLAQSLANVEKCSKAGTILENIS